MFQGELYGYAHFLQVQKMAPADVKFFWEDVVCKYWKWAGKVELPPAMIHSDEGLTLETSVFESFTVANLPYRPCGFSDSCNEACIVCDAWKSSCLDLSGKNFLVQVSNSLNNLRAGTVITLILFIVCPLSEQLFWAKRSCIFQDSLLIVNSLNFSCAM